MNLRPTLLLLCVVALAPAARAAAVTATTAAPVPAALVSGSSAHTQFTVRASRFFLWTNRQVSVRGSLNGLSGELQIGLDRPVRAILGIGALEINVHVLDDQGREVTKVVGRIEDGGHGCTIPLSFSAPGRYHLVLNDEDLVAGAANLRVIPAGSARMELVATAAAVSATR